MAGRWSWGRLLAWAVAWLALAAHAGAQGTASPGEERARVSMTVRGVAGPIIKARPGRFLAVNVVLENGAPKDQDGVLRVYRADRPRSPVAAQGLFYERRVPLPAGGRRTETVYYYCQEDEPEQRLVVAFVPQDGPAPDPSYPSVEVDGSRLAALIVSGREEKEADRVFRAASVPGPRHAWRVEPQQADLGLLPDQACGYDPFDVVVVTDLNQGDIPPDRAAALLDWVAAGNHLVVAFDGRSTLPPELRAALPVSRPAGPDRHAEGSLQALRTLGRGEWPGDEPALVDDVTAAPGADVLAGPAARPLVVRGRWGAGWVTYLAFPLDAAALRRWRGLGAFGGALVRPPRGEILGRSTPLPAPPLEELQQNLSEALVTLTPPSGLVVAPLLVLYVVLVAPFNYVVFARRRRLGLTQPVAAVVVVLFALLFYAMGRLYKGSTDLVTQVAVTELPVTPVDAPAPAGPRARGRVDVLTGYYSTRQGLIGAEAPAGAAIGPIAEQATSREGRIVQGGPRVGLEQLTVATWSLRRFRALRVADVGHLGADLTVEDGALRGTLVNATQVGLEGVVVLLPQGIVELGRLAPGVELELPGRALTPWASARPEALGLVAAIRRDATNGYPALYGSDTSMGGLSGDPYGGSVGARILASFRGRLDRVPASSDRLPALVVGCAHGDPGGVVIEGTGEPTLARSFVLSEVQVAVAGRRLAFEALAPVVLEPIKPGFWTAVDGPTGAAPSIGGNLADEAVVGLGWSLPSSIERPLRLDRLRIRLDSDQKFVIPGVAHLDVWNVQRQGWVEAADLQALERDGEDGLLRWTAGQGALTRPEDLIDPSSGAVTVRLRNQGVDFHVERLVLDASGTRE